MQLLVSQLTFLLIFLFLLLPIFTMFSGLAKGQAVQFFAHFAMPLFNLFGYFSGAGGTLRSPHITVCPLAKVR